MYLASLSLTHLLLAPLLWVKASKWPLLQIIWAPCDLFTRIADQLLLFFFCILRNVSLKGALNEMKAQMCLGPS